MVNPCLQSDRAKEIQERSKKQSRWGSGEFFRFTNWPAIAFDLDHTLVRYQIRPLFKLCYEQVVHFLKTNVHEYRNLEFRPFGEMDLKFAQRGIYYDRQRGFMLKLDENGDIMQAFYGTEEMSLTEIKDDYAGCRQLITLRHGPFIRPEGSSVTQPLLHCFDDFFTVGTIYLLMELIQFTKDGKLIHYGFERPFRYLMAAYSAIFAKDDFQKRQHGFFSALTERPTEYLYRASFLFKKWLGRLRRRNIAVIVITNSAADFAHFLLDFGIGDDWRKYIDALVTDARKPYFFSFTRRPFYLMNGTQEVREAIPSDFTVPMYLSQGSMAEMKYVIKGATDHLTHRMLYVGDSLVNELYACYLLKNCGLIGVAEELEAECGSAWGPFLGSEAKPTFWRKKLEEWLTALVASVEKLAGGKPDEDIRASTKFLRIFKSGNGNKKSPAR